MKTAGRRWGSANDRLVTAGIVVTALLSWEVAARVGWVPAIFFPAPTVIMRTLAKLFVEGTMTANLAITLQRVFLGLLLGGVPGLVLGLGMGWSSRLRGILDPLVAAAHPIPKIAVLPLIMIIFGIGETSKVVVVAIGCFFPMLINTMAGVRQINPSFLDVARNYGARLHKVFTKVILPGSLPLVMAGARLALNLALLLTIAVELVSAREGLGAMIWFSWETLRTEELYASLVIIGVLGSGFNAALERLSTRLLPWSAAGQD